MLKYGSNNIERVKFGSHSIGKILIGSNVVFQKGLPPVRPYIPVEYIATDGYAYIDTGILGNDPRSAEIKCLPVASTSYILASSNATESSGNYALLYVSTYGGAGRTAAFGHYYYYSSSAPSVQDSYENSTPFEARISMKKGAQSMSVKQYGESSFTTYNTTNNSTITTNRNLYLFASNTGSAAIDIASGTRVYYCKIYSDATFGTLVFDGIPCYYNGAYGLWDNVSDAFFGNAANSGAFIGPSII